MKIVILGGTGSFGTALGNVLSLNENNQVVLIGRDKKLIDFINKNKINVKRYPNLKLNENIRATTNLKVLSSSDIVFLSLPSSVVVEYLKEIKKFLNRNSLLVNVAKGFGTNGYTIPESLNFLKNEIVSFKGPTFASELIRNLPSGFTVGAKDKNIFSLFKEITEGTNIFLDFSKDVKGVEIVSILKNIYAIATGIVDAYFNSANARALILTKAFREMSKILKEFRCSQEVLFKYCGFGDLVLTSLHDLSRNRTLGLMIGKGFLSPKIEHSVVLEGKRAIKEVKRKMNKKIDGILDLVYKLLYEGLSIHEFVRLVFE